MIKKVKNQNLSIKNISFFGLMIVSITPFLNLIFVSIINLFLISLMSLQKRFDRQLLLKIFLFLFLIIFNLAFYYHRDYFNFYFFSQINNYIQLIIYFLCWSIFFIYSKNNWINLIRANYFVLLFSLFICLINNAKIGEFTLLLFLLFVISSINDQTKDNIVFFLLITIAFLFFERFSIFFSTFIFIMFKFFKNSYYFRLSLKLFTILLIIYPFIVPILPISVFEYLIDYNHNFFFRIQCLKSAYELMNKDIMNYFFGVGFSYPYRESLIGNFATVPHFYDAILLNTVPNHNSFFDLYYRFGIFALLFFLFFQYKLIITKYKDIDIGRQILLINTIFVFECSVNPWFEAQSELILSSFLFSYLFYLSRYAEQKV